MPRRRIARSSIVALLLVGAAACGVTADLPSSTGSVDVGFINVGDFSIDHVDYAISGNGIAPLEGSIAVGDSASAPSAYVGGIPPGTQYLLELSASYDDGRGQCYGAATFDVVLGETSAVMISLLCSYPTKVRTTMVNGMTDYCPSLASYAAAPPIGTVGGAPLSLTATAFTFYSDPPQFMWTASSGELSASSASVSMYTCTTPGPVTLTVTVTDGYCPDTAMLSVTCLPAPTAAPDASDSRGQDGGRL